VSPRFLPAPSRRRKRWIRAGICIVLLVAVTLAYGFGETYRLDVKEYAFTSADLPKSFDGTRVVFLTDIHRGRFFSQERVADLVDRVNALQPDLIVLGGDYVRADVGYEASCFTELARLQAPLGRFAVLGNHDYGEHDDDASTPDQAIREADSAGITLLRNEGAWIERNGGRIRIGGVGDYEEDVPRLAPALGDARPEDFVLLLSHNPDFSESLPSGAVDLTLSGHTHGGQVSIFGLWAPYVPSDYGQKYRTGIVSNGATTVIVSNGIGTSTIPPIRILVRPQIVVVTLHSSPSAAVQP
jgi:predicted MPP superfamily phosphohydrolase